MPYHTTVVNHHIYNHTYTPVYSYSEVDEVENIYTKFVEFFGKFYEGGGKAYAPFAVNTRHFQIKEEK